MEDRSKFGSAHDYSQIDKQVAEEYLLSQFKNAAHHFAEASTMPANTLEWLALMQHYGAPTRLLDFTRSPYVACFFALEKCTLKKDTEQGAETEKATLIENCGCTHFSPQTLLTLFWRLLGSSRELMSHDGAQWAFIFSG